MAHTVARGVKMAESERLFTSKQLHALVPYSRAHIARLEKTGSFPKRVRLGQNRVAWLVSEVQAWIAERAEARYDD